MTPHPRCQRWFHALRATCSECSLRVELERVSEDTTRKWFRKHWPDGGRPHLKKGGGK